MKKTFEQIKKEIEREFIGGRYDGITATEEILTEIIGVSVEEYDTKIDDGADGDETEDCYIMKASFSTKDDVYTIHIYYGDVTEEIGYVDVIQLPIPEPIKTMSAKKRLNDFRLSIKEQICNILTDKFKELNDGLLPDWSNDEEIYIEGDEIGLHLKVNVEVSNTYDENRCFEEWVISSYVVTLDYNLFFNCNDNELEWTDISTDDLVGICSALQNKL